MRNENGKMRGTRLSEPKGQREREGNSEQKVF